MRIKPRQINLSFIICHLSFSAALLMSCSMMKEDRSDCPDCYNPLRIKLRYDYNTARADMFNDHVEQATVYVTDPATGTVIDWQTASNSSEGQPLRQPSFAFNFEGLRAGSYRLYATGCSKADLAYKTTAPDISEAISKLSFTVPATADGNVPAQRLDTLWNTLQPVDVTLSEDNPTEATVRLMRLTNDLNVIVFRRDGSLDNGHERYDVTVTDQHLTLGNDNEPTADQPLTYRPFAAWTTETLTDDTRADEGTVAERNAHYDLSLSRLLLHPDDARRNARLIIRNRESGHEIVNIDLCYYLALARNAYELHHYSQQEYLDREYDYRLDFGFAGEKEQETWKYMTISINVLSWALRIQNEDL